MTFDNMTREELGNLSVIFWQDQYFMDNMKVEKAFIENQKYRNMYEGYSAVIYPAYADFGGIIHLMAIMKTSKTSGSLQTPWYGDTFDENFDYAAYFQYYIYFPTDLNVTYPDLKLVLHFHVDVMLYGSTEEVYYRKGSTQIQLSLSYFLVLYCFNFDGMSCGAVLENTVVAFVKMILL